MDTIRIIDINPGGGSSAPDLLTNVNGTLFFTANDGINGRELWMSSGTPANPVLVKDINPGSSNALGEQSYLTDVNGTLFFRANDGVNGSELWKSDGTQSGTVMVKDINLGSGGSFARFLTDVNGTLFFTADNGTNDYKLWKSDGTEAGTVLVKDINLVGDSKIEGLTNVNGTLFFYADDNINGSALWKSDGTEAGTVLVKDINPDSDFSNPYGFTNVNGTLFFVEDDGFNGYALWKSDGTEAGTVLVKDTNIGGIDSFGPNRLTNVNGTLFFSAEDENNDVELWKSDGTEAGTVRVKNINPASGDSFSSGSFPDNLTNVNGTLFFTAGDGFTDVELWKSDGTEAGTVRVKDINPGSNSSEPIRLTNVNGTLFFTADNGVNGRELWKSDGTEAGTVLVQDLNPGGNSSDPSNLTDFNGTLFFKADNGVAGRELAVLETTPPNTAPTDLSLSAASVNENVAVNTIIGTFATTDAQGGNFTYAFVNGTSDSDNSAFTIDGSQLKINASPDFEAKSSYSIRVKTTDDGGLSYEEALTIGVNNVNEVPTVTGETITTSQNTGNPVVNVTVDVGDNLFDPDANGLAGATLAVTSTSNGTIASIDQIGQMITFTPTAGFSGAASFNYTLTDAGGLTSNVATVSVNVGSILSTGNKGQDVEGTSGDDYIAGGNGKDTLRGRAGRDTLLGNNGNDILYGDAGNDILDGGNGDDILYGGLGNDRLTGGNGPDTFVFAAGEGTDTITDFSNDKIGLSGGLSFGSLSFSNNNILFGNEVLAILTGVNTTTLTQSHFVTI